MPVAASLRAPLILLAAVALAYSSAVIGGFQFDDFNVIVDNLAVTHWPPDLSGLRPLLKLSYAINWALGEGPAGFHAFNVLVHWLNSVLVLALGLRLSHQHLPAEDASYAALVAALLFALHPAHTEAVTYVSGRSSSLMTCFYLASLLGYAHGRSLNSRRWMWAVSPLLFGMALLTKEAAVTLPLALLLWDRCCTADRATRLPWWQLQWVHWTLLLCAVGAGSLHAGYAEMLLPSLTMDTLRTQVHGVAYLTSRWIQLDGMNIDPDLRRQDAWSVALVAQSLGIAALFVAGARCMRRRPWLGFGLIWFFIQLLPGNTLILRWDVANERQLYLAGIGLLMAVGIEWVRLAQRRSPRVATCALGALLAVLAAFTWSRNLDYRSEVALWEDTVRKSPAKARAHNNLGEAYRLAGSADMARASFQRALALDPGYLLARNNLNALDSPTANRSSPPAAAVTPD